MRSTRPALALDPRSFGRRPAFSVQAVPTPRSINDDLRLFAITFAAGFLFVSIIIA